MAPSPRRYDSKPPAWEYPGGRRSGEPGVQRQAQARRQTIAGPAPLAGEYVQLIRRQQRVLILYCNTILRELDLAVDALTSVEPSAAYPDL